MISGRHVGSEVVFAIRDTRMGLDASQIDRWFQPFTQVPDAMAVIATGTGLGLFIGGGSIAAHDGRIWAESQGLGRGSTFAFALHRAVTPIPGTQTTAVGGAVSSAAVAVASNRSDNHI